MKYPLTFHWAKGVGEGHAASTRGPFIFIKPKYEGDRGLYQHELMHVKQWAVVTLVSALLIAAVYSEMAMISIGVHGLLYLTFPKYKLWCEVQAYKKQLRYYPDDRTATFARFIAYRYGLDDVTQIEAEQLLRS